MIGARGGTATGGGAGMLGTFRRAVRSGAADPFSHSSTSSSSYGPISTSPSRPLVLSATRRDDLDWVSVDETGDEIAEGFDSVFGAIPSMDEVLNAVTALQLVIDPPQYSLFLEDNRTYSLENTAMHEDARMSRVSSFGSESDWIEPSLHLCHSMRGERPGSIRFYEAFHLLRTEPFIKRMVVSLSSDKAVWDAVWNNKVVRELRGLVSEVENKLPEGRDDNNDRPKTATNIFTWVYENTKVKLIDIIVKIAERVNELFRLSDAEKTEESITGRTAELLQISLMLSIMVLIIVVIDRVHGP